MTYSVLGASCVSKSKKENTCWDQVLLGEEVEKRGGGKEDRFVIILVFVRNAKRIVLDTMKKKMFHQKHNLIGI